MARLLALTLLLAEGRKYTARVASGNPEAALAPDCPSGCQNATMPPCLAETLVAPIEAAGAEGVDIIIFPETYFGPSANLWACGPPADSDLLPPVGSQLCSHDGKWWGQLGCLAKQHQVIVVVGMWDWGECVVSPEPFTHRAFPCKGNLTIFNKALAVGADGTLLAVHHKHHLAHALMAKEQTSMERGSVVINPSPWGVFNDDVGSAWPVPAVTIFTSHFGVKFGLVTCHELNFASPFLSILKAGVRDVIHIARWGSFAGNFAATQSGTAMAHGVNLLASNGFNGGSGIWPARAPLDAVQVPIRADTPAKFAPLWFGTMALESPGPVVLPQVAAPAPVYPVRSRTVVLDAAKLKRTQLVLEDVTCQLDPQPQKAAGLFLLGASAGITAVGLFEASCWLMSCELLLSLENSSALMPDLAPVLQRPLTQEDLRKCRKSPGPLTFAGSPRLSIRAPGSNFFLPIGQCNNGSVPLPRPSTEAKNEAGRSHSLALPTCPLNLAGVRSFAQSEFEEPSCPNGFCPSPSPCNDSSWEMHLGGWCPMFAHVGVDKVNLWTHWVTAPSQDL
ncbi:unnamed protein product [Effrenium voratum]|nr:unnamed protein product [Effrenium voratum]